MSVYKGGKGARQRRRDERYYAAVGRQLLMHDRGFYDGFVTTRSAGYRIPIMCTPAPVEQFLRPEHRGLTADPGIDFRSWAGDGRAAS